MTSVQIWKSLFQEKVVMEKLTKGHDGKANDRRGFHGNYAVKSA